MNTIIIIFMANICLSLAGYNIRIDRLVVDYVNKEYVYGFQVKAVMVNRTRRAFTVCMGTRNGIKKHDLNLNIKSYYIKDNMDKFTGIQFNLDPCTPLSENSFGVYTILHDTNITACPMPKGYYCANELRGDIADLPPGVPESLYMMKLTFSRNTVDIVKARFYAEVKRTIA